MGRRHTTNGWNFWATRCSASQSRHASFQSSQTYLKASSHSVAPHSFQVLPSPVLRAPSDWGNTFASARESDARGDETKTRFSQTPSRRLLVQFTFLRVQP